jgi:hypothetical protein
MNRSMDVAINAFSGDQVFDERWWHRWPALQFNIEFDVGAHFGNKRVGGATRRKYNSVEPNPGSDAFGRALCV